MDEIHEECGVFGIWSPPGTEVAEDIYAGLVALQHRGQESAGAAVTDTGGARGNIAALKGMGLVSEVFGPKEMESLKGNMGVGHVRYSTTGESSLTNAQPIVMNYIKGTLVFVHNGNIVNADEIRQNQMYRGQAHYTTTDSEVFAYEIISRRIEASSIEEAVLDAAKSMKGGYACIIMSPGKLVGIRDPYGIKPLVIGKKGSAYILASESAAVEAVGGILIRDVRPGEIVTLAEGSKVLNPCVRAGALIALLNTSILPVLIPSWTGWRFMTQESRQGGRLPGLLRQRRTWSRGCPIPDLLRRRALQRNQEFRLRWRSIRTVM